MMMTPDVLDAWTVERSIKGLGTDDDTLIEILCTRDNYQIKAMRDAYQQSERPFFSRSWFVFPTFFLL